MEVNLTAYLGIAFFLLGQSIAFIVSLVKLSTKMENRFTSLEERSKQVFREVLETKIDLRELRRSYDKNR